MYDKDFDSIIELLEAFSDEHLSYKWWHNHGMIKHSSGEYVDGMIHTNGIESVWAVLKRGLIGIYHSCSVKHLQRYVSEYMFRLSLCQMSVEQQIGDLFSVLFDTHISYRKMTR